MTSLTSPNPSSALVTGASSGIGRATVKKLLEQGWTVFAAARRSEKLESLAEETHEFAGKLITVACDVTRDDSVNQLLDVVTEHGGLDTVLNIAGGALGNDPIAEGSLKEWQWMYETNVLGTLRVTQAFLPMLRENGEGTILNLTSTAALATYEGGGGYNAAKMGQSAITGALRLEEAEHNVRIIEVLPGLVKTEEFARNRFHGDEEAAARVYEGVSKPLTSEDVADVCAYAVGLPHHVNLDQIVMRPVKQAAQFKLLRDGK